MAVKKQHGYSGLVGTVVVYSMNGKEVVRSRPRKHEKSGASQNASALFGLASSISAKLRKKLRHAVGVKDARYRLDAKLRQWIENTGAGPGSFSWVDNFQFNEKAVLADKTRILPSVNWDAQDRIEITMPGFNPLSNIAAPAFTESVKFIIEVAGVALAGVPASRPLYASAVIEVPIHRSPFPEQHIVLPFEMEQGELAIVVLALRYVVNKNGTRFDLDDPQWTPSGVIGSKWLH